MAANRRQKAATALRENIADGKLRPGDRIGASLSAIAREYGVGTTTMQGVLSDLAAEGIVRKDHGVGYFVIGAPDQPGPAPGYAALEKRVEALEVGLMEVRMQRSLNPRSQDRKARNEQAG